MEIIKRLAKVILTIVLIPLILIEMPYYAIRWIITGEPKLEEPTYVKSWNWF